MGNTVNDIMALLESGTEQVIPHDRLKEKLESGNKLCVKLGVDPTAPDLHLGHAVVLGKLKQFQDLGHKVIFLIGDFTAKIGDPTGKSKLRPSLSDEDIKHNTQTYFDQVKKILDPDKIEVRYNSEWLSKLTVTEMVRLCAKVTVSQLIERNDFAKRLDKKQPINMHELLYPLFQGYDSVALKADIELGGTDQTFNLLMGRHLQEHYDQEPQVVITVPILEGLDGVHKMSKSLGNAIGLFEPANEAYGKLMSISDRLMWRYFELLLGYTENRLQQMKVDVAEAKVHPMDLKKAMAFEVVDKFWSTSEAKVAQESFEKLFQKKDYSVAEEVEIPLDTPNPVWIVNLLRLLGAIKNSSEAKRLIEAGAVKANGDTIVEFKAEVEWHPGMIIKVGKHRIYQIKK